MNSDAINTTEIRWSFSSLTFSWIPWRHDFVDLPFVSSDHRSLLLIRHSNTVCSRLSSLFVSWLHQTPFGLLFHFILLFTYTMLESQLEAAWSSSLMFPLTFFFSSIFRGNQCLPFFPLCVFLSFQQCGESCLVFSSSGDLSPSELSKRLNHHEWLLVVAGGLRLGPRSDPPQWLLLPLWIHYVMSGSRKVNTTARWGSESTRAPLLSNKVLCGCVPCVLFCFFFSVKRFPVCLCLSD